MESSSKATETDSSLSKKSYAFHAHDAREVLSLIGAHEQGLSKKEIEHRRAQYGRNEFTQKKQDTLFDHLIAQFKSPLALVLVLAFFVTLSLQEYIDAAVIGAALLVAVFVGVLQEGKSSQAFTKLARSQIHKATVIREGIKHEIEASELVIGDIVVLQGGMQVPADIRIMHAKQLAINEAVLTGEWIAVDKQSKPVAVGSAFAEQTSMAWKGTYVASGYSTGVVVAIGDSTAVGKLAQSVQNVEDTSTPLQEEMMNVSRLMLYLIVGLVLLIFFVGLYQSQSLHDMLLLSIAIAVAAVPEGLPAAVTIVLAIGMETLLKRGGLVRNLLAAETLGSTTYVLTDKTGTLTQAKMSVTGVITQQAYEDLKTVRHKKVVTRLFDVALAAADAYTDKNTKQKIVHGDPVEVAVVKGASEVGISEFENSLRAQRVDYYAFTSENRFAAGLSEHDDAFRLCCNGAPDTLLAYAEYIETADGKKRISQEEKKHIIASIAQQTKLGKRLVAVGYKDVDYDAIPEKGHALMDDLVLVGVMVFDDPVRDGVKDAIAGVQSAGAHVVLITGDNPQTALSIAQQVGIVGEDGVAFTGKELEELSDEELLVALTNVRVFARVLPNQKMRIVSILQQKGEIVAMTGDGINDAPALRKANIGVAIGSGTEVAKEASDLVLMKDSFATIYAAIEEGRRVIANLRKIVAYLLSTSLSEAVLIGMALLLGNAAPILPVQILWANIIEEGLMSVAFAFEKGDKDAMKRKPRDIHEEGILSKSMLYFTAMVITIHSTLLIALYLYLQFLQLPLDELRSVMFIAVAADSLFIAFAFRSLTLPIWKIPLLNNIFFVGSFLLNMALLLCVLSIPFLQSVLSYVPLTPQEFIMVLVFSLSTLMVVEVAKWLFFEKED